MKIPLRSMTKKSAFFHLILAFLLFSPFFFSGKVALMSADNYFHHFPNMILSHRFFNNGEWGFWNSYIYGGMDFTASAHNFIFYPLNWLIFSFPEKYFFILMTLRMFLEVWLIGIFSYLFFKEELHDDQWALFSSTVYQLGGFTLFGLLVYSSLTINLLFIIALYLIFTLHQRKCWLSYIFLTLAIFGLITSFNLGYFLATSISLLIIAAYRFSSFLKNTPEKRMYLYTLMASVVTGVLLGMVRLFPFLHGLMTEGTRMHATELQTTPGGIYLALTAFVPELMGIQISNAVHLLGNVTGHTGWHPQDNTYFYFGTLPVLLLCWACTRIKKIQAPFWFLSWAIASLWFLRIPPVSNVLDFAVFPFFHIAIPKMMIPISFCVLMGHAAKSLEADPRQFDRKSTISLAVILGLVGITILNFYGRTFPAVAGYYRVILPGAAFLAAAIFALKRFKPALLKKGLAPALFALMTGGIFILLHSVSLTGNESFRLSIRCSSFLISLLSGILLYHQIKSNQTTNKKRFLCYAAFLILAGLFMAVPFKAVGLFGALGFRALTAVLGVVRFMIIAGFFLYFMHHVQSGKMSPNRLFYFFIFLVLCEMIPYNKIYNHSISPPFYDGTWLYPERSLVLENLDTKNYAVNQPLQLLSLLDNDPESNVHAVYGIRSSGGVNSDFPRRHAVFLNNFNHPTQAPNGVTGNFADPRLKDLTGCRYDMADGKRVMRPGALPRFMLFHDFQIMNDDAQTLAQLRQTEFDPLKKVILAEDPGVDTGSRQRPAIPWDYQSSRSDVLNLTMNTDAPGLLFFGDSYHPDWRAFINGTEQKVLRANYKFMAVAIPAGENHIVFKFIPKAFYLGLCWAKIGAVLFLTGACLLYWFQRKNT